MEELGMNGFTNPSPSFWRGKRILLTGHTGFKGAWFALWLKRLGAQVVGVSLPPATTPNLFELAKIDALIESRFADIRNSNNLATVVQAVRPEIVFHLAAQALVRVSYRDPLMTFETNVQGTANVLDAVRVSTETRVVIAITTDKVYQNLEQPLPYRESDTLGGHDPYSASKAAAELVIASYREAYLAKRGVAVASVRAGNVIGGGDWSEDRLIPDAVRSWSSGAALLVRRPQSIRPWQHVLEPLAGYLILAERIWDQPGLAGAYNFGPQTHEAATVRHVVELARAAYGAGEVSWGDGADGPHEAGWLALEIAKARTVIGFSPRWSLTQSVERSMTWYRQHLKTQDARQLCFADIDAYEAAVGASA